MEIPNIGRILSNSLLSLRTMVGGGQSSAELPMRDNWGGDGIGSFEATRIAFIPAGPDKFNLLAAVITHYAPPSPYDDYRDIARNVHFGTVNAAERSQILAAFEQQPLGVALVFDPENDHNMAPGSFANGLATLSFVAPAHRLAALKQGLKLA